MNITDKRTYVFFLQISKTAEVFFKGYSRHVPDCSECIVMSQQGVV